MELLIIIFLWHVLLGILLLAKWTVFCVWKGRGRADALDWALDIVLITSCSGFVGLMTLQAKHPESRRLPWFTALVTVTLIASCVRTAQRLFSKSRGTLALLTGLVADLAATGLWGLFASDIYFGW